jgi:hypothetical protein
VSLHCARAAADCAQNCAAAYYPNTVTVEVWEWSGERLGDGQRTVVSSLELARREVREISDRRIYGAGGFYEIGDIEMLDITPQYTRSDATTGGYSAEQLDPARAFPAGNRRREVRYRVTGDIEGLYRFHHLDQNDVTAWRLVLRKTTESEDELE